MKYNDKASKDFQQRSTDGSSSPRAEARKQQRAHEYRQALYRRRIASLSHPLCAVMNTKQRIEIYTEFMNGTNGNWSNNSKIYDFYGKFNDFLDFLLESGDKRILRYKVKLRDHNIDTLLED